MQPYLRGAPPGLPFTFDNDTIRRGLNFTLSTTAGDLDVMGIRALETAVIADAGHFIPDEQPAASWRAIQRAPAAGARHAQR